MEGFLELSLVSLCRIQAASLATTDDKLLTVFAFVIYAVLVIFMLSTGFFLYLYHSQIDKESFKDKFGTLVEGLNSKEIILMLYPSLFMFRRLLVAFIIVYMQERSFSRSKASPFFQAL